MSGKQEQVIRWGIAAWLLLVLAVPLGAGCAGWNRVRDRAAADRQQFLEALAPLADPRGGATTSKGQEIEKGMAKSADFLP